MKVVFIRDFDTYQSAWTARATFCARWRRSPRKRCT